MKQTIAWTVLAAAAMTIPARSADVHGATAGASASTEKEQEGLLAWWRFDEDAGRTVRDGVTRSADPLSGNYRFVAGVQGKGLKCDGFTTAVTRKADAAPRLGDAFTIESWVAVQAYPWGWCPVVGQRENRSAGYFFGLDARGRVGLHVAGDGQWHECTSQQGVPLMEWVHVACTFDAGSGLTVYIDGIEAGRLDMSGAPTYASSSDLLIGRNHDKEHAMFSSEWGRPEQPVHFAFDGILDEVKIHDRCLTPAQVRAAFEATRPDGPPELTLRRMPSGPADVKAFGAFYHHLAYCWEWDSIWRGCGPDIVVAFPFAPVRLVFWRGISYAPCWVTEKGNWFSNEFMERGLDRQNRGCSESMSDKRAHYSHVKILENSDARAVVYWRNAPAGVNYELAYVDELTGWGDWSEEYHTVYPDGVAVRKVVMWSSDFEAWHEWCQSIIPLHPGQRPEDVLDADRLLSVANMKGETATFGRESGEKSYRYPTIPRANIQIAYLNSRYNPFLILDDRDGKNDRGGQGPDIARATGEGWSEHSIFPWRNHWPVTQVPVFGRFAQAADRPAHTWVATQFSAPCATTDHSMTKIMLTGLTDKPIEELLPLARSWLRPPTLTVGSPMYVNEGYDPTQRAYILTCQSPGRPRVLKADLNASEERPLVNLALVVKGWGNADVALCLNGEPLEAGKGFAAGHRERLDGDDLTVWIEMTATAPRHIELTPVRP